MAIRNINLGGASNWGSERITGEDLNDTFNAAADKVNSLSAFWLNSDLYDVYDDFEAYSVGSFSTNSKWTINLVNSGSATIVSSTISGGTGKELRLVGQVSGTDTGTAEAITRFIGNNKHKHIKLAFNVNVAGGGSGVSSTAHVQMKIGSQSYSTLISVTVTDDRVDSFTVNGDLLVIAKGSDNYDVYFGGKKIFDNVNEADPELSLIAYGSGNSAFSHVDMNLYIDDVRESKGSV